MKENLYIKSHKYTNPEYRDEYERIFEDRDDLERDIQTEKGDEMLDLYPADRTPLGCCDIIVEDGGWWRDKLDPLPLDWTFIYLDNSIEAQIYREMEKGQVTGHFV